MKPLRGGLFIEKPRAKLSFCFSAARFYTWLSNQIVGMISFGATNSMLLRAAEKQRERGR